MTMTPQEEEIIEGLRKQGYIIVVFDPEELTGLTEEDKGHVWNKAGREGAELAYELKEWNERRNERIQST